VSEDAATQREIGRLAGTTEALQREQRDGFARLEKLIGEHIEAQRRSCDACRAATAAEIEEVRNAVAAAKRLAGAAMGKAKAPAGDKSILQRQWEWLGGTKVVLGLLSALGTAVAAVWFAIVKGWYP